MNATATASHRPARLPNPSFPNAFAEPEAEPPPRGSATGAGAGPRPWGVAHLDEGEVRGHVAAGLGGGDQLELVQRPPREPPRPGPRLVAAAAHPDKILIWILRTAAWWARSGSTNWCVGGGGCKRQGFLSVRLVDLGATRPRATGGDGGGDGAAGLPWGAA